MTSRPSHVHELLTRQAAQRPDREALRFGDQTWTWADLVGRVARAAAAQRAEGLVPGSRIAVLDLNHPSCLETTLACAQVGSANVVVNFRLTPSEIEYVLTDSGAEVLLVGPEFADVVDGLREKLTAVRRVIRVGGDADEYEAWLDREPDHDVHPAQPDDCFLQLYTSGTTGFPKGAELTHKGMIAHSAAVAELVEADDDATLLVAMPLFHVGGSSYTLSGLYAGARTVMTRVPDPAQLLQLLETERVTHSFFVPALLAMMTKLPAAKEHDYSALKALCYGASPMPLPVLRASMDVFPNVFMQVYGMTEACGVVTALMPSDHESEELLTSAGKPIHGVRIEVRDPATGTQLGVGEQGEIWVSTDQLMRGYWRKPEATASAIDADGWYHSGDAGHFDENGYLFITDRIKDMIISGGENIYPAEIERVLAEHPTIDDVTVVGVPDDRWGEVPKAVVVAAKGQTINEAELLSYCREHLASYKCPKSVDVVDELPRNPTGKILKKDVRARYWEGRDRQTV